MAGMSVARVKLLQEETVVKLFTLDARGEPRRVQRHRVVDWFFHRRSRKGVSGGQGQEEELAQKDYEAFIADSAESQTGIEKSKGVTEHQDFRHRESGSFVKTNRLRPLHS